MDNEQQQQQSSNGSEPLIEISVPLILLGMVPLMILAWVSWQMKLKLESAIVVGMFRTFIQLSILSVILEPIFLRGQDWLLLVLSYILFMIILASYESSNRPKYCFSGIFYLCLFSLISSVLVVSLFGFGMILKPKPAWNPQYVIPIVGMLLGNCINGISLSLNAMLTSFVEDSKEIELYLSFGANRYEATGRLVREAVRTGAMPQLNGMAIIGLVSIPGMMTGEILSGSSITLAARYQMLIIYLIATCSFTTIFIEIYFVIQIAFDRFTMLRTDRFIKRAEKPTFLNQLSSIVSSLLIIIGRKSANIERSSSSSSPSFGLLGSQSINESLSSSYTTPKGRLEINALHQGLIRSDLDKLLEVSNLSKSFEKTDENVDGMTNNGDPFCDGDTTTIHTTPATPSSSLLEPTTRTLFKNITFEVYRGELLSVSGPSGCGKSTLLRIVAGLASHDQGEIILCGDNYASVKDTCLWRQQIRYVTQHKVDIPGTPLDFLKQIANFQVWKRPNLPTFIEMKTTAKELLKRWDLDSSCLDSEWSFLSGGESQRVILALALASKPLVLLLDESTSAIDNSTKKKVETSIVEFAIQNNICVLLVSHDQEQIERMRQT